jgi:hypothetical protein
LNPSVIFQVVPMRIFSVLLLMTSTCALAACAGGGADGGLSAAGVLASQPGVCSILDTTCDVTPEVITPTSTLPDSDGDGIPDADEDDGAGDGNTGSGAGGNTTAHSAGNKTIALGRFVLEKPVAGSTSLAKITSASKASYELTEAALLAGAPPSSLKITVDTKTAKNSQWSVPEEMPEYSLGSRDLRWIEVRHTNIDLNIPGNRFVNIPGEPQIEYDPAKRAFVYTATFTTPERTYVAGTIVDHTADRYWTEIRKLMGSKANGAFGDKYREYRIISDSVDDLRDEVLQVWTWNKSYSTQYQNQIGGGAPKQQAWSFGGEEATNIPVSGKSRYAGRFVGTAKTEGWKKVQGSKVDPNALWMVQGRSDVTADFDTSTMRGTLSPETWTSYQADLDGEYTWFTPEAAVAKPPNITTAASVGNGAFPDYYDIYGAQVKLNGVIKAGEPVTSGGVTTTPKNAIEGTAAVTGNFYSGDNPVYAGLFGANADELTGVFSVKGTAKSPLGGSTGVVDPKAATIVINGSFNGQCQPGVTCAP